MTAKEILYAKAAEKDDCFLTGQIGWIVEAMEESNAETAIAFAKWINAEGYQEYDEKDRWIAPHNNYNVYTTKQLYEMFLLTKKGRFYGEIF